MKKFSQDKNPKSPDDYQAKYTRILADYHNLTKQVAKDKAELIKLANSNILQDILPVYEYLKISLEHCEESSGIIDGLKHTLNLFQKALQDHGVTEIETTKAQFDHQSMEAVESRETSDESLDNCVAEQRQSGYQIYDKILRPARVVVYKYKERESTN